MKKLTNKQKLEKAIKALKIYANLDFWNHKSHSPNPIRKCVYTSLEVKDRKGNINDGWIYAEEVLKEIE